MIDGGSTRSILCRWSSGSEAANQERLPQILLPAVRVRHPKGVERLSDDGIASVYDTMLSYPAPAAVARRYVLDGDLADALASIDALISAVIDR